MPALLHIVSLRFKPELSDAFIRAHFEKDVRLKERMPELVESFQWGPNTSLLTRADVNGGCQWVVVCKLYDASTLQAYISHPEHKEVGVIQGPLLDGRFVVDVEVA